MPYDPWPDFPKAKLESVEQKNVERAKKKRGDEVGGLKFLKKITVERVHQDVLSYPWSARAGRTHQTPRNKLTQRVPQNANLQSFLHNL